MKKEITKARRRCSHGLKAAGAVCVDRKAPVHLALNETINTDLNRAQRFVGGLPQRIREVVAAAKAVRQAAGQGQ